MNTASHSPSLRHPAFAWLAGMFAYPEESSPARWREIAHRLVALNPRVAGALGQFINLMEAMESGERESLYLRTWEVAPVCVPYVGIHLFGEENFQRGAFMARLLDRYRELDQCSHSPVSHVISDCGNGSAGASPYHNAGSVAPSGLPGSADFRSAVAQVSNLRDAETVTEPSRLQIGDTAEYNSALRQIPCRDTNNGGDSADAYPHQDGAHGVTRPTQEGSAGASPYRDAGSVGPYCDGLASELPDHLAVILCFASRIEGEELTDLIKYCLLRPLEKMKEALKAGNPYANLLDAVLIMLRDQFPHIEAAPLPVEQMRSHSLCGPPSPSLSACHAGPCGSRSSTTALQETL